MRKNASKTVTKLNDEFNNDFSFILKNKGNVKKRESLFRIAIKWGARITGKEIKSDRQKAIAYPALLVIQMQDGGKEFLKQKIESFSRGEIDEMGRKIRKKKI